MQASSPNTQPTSPSLPQQPPYHKRHHAPHLQRTWAVNADKAGLNLGQMKSGLGHARSETTVGYTNRQVTLGLEEARRVARQLGVDSDGHSGSSDAAAATG